MRVCLLVRTQTELELQRCMPNLKSRRILLLLHRADVLHPPAGRTAHWLAARATLPLSFHFHVQVYERFFAKRTPDALASLSYINSYF